MCVVVMVEVGLHCLIDVDGLQTDWITWNGGRRVELPNRGC